MIKEASVEGVKQSPQKKTSTNKFGFKSAGKEIISKDDSNGPPRMHTTSSQKKIDTYPTS